MSLLVLGSQLLKVHEDPNACYDKPHVPEAVMTRTSGVSAVSELAAVDTSSDVSGDAWLFFAPSALPSSPSALLLIRAQYVCLCNAVDRFFCIQGTLHVCNVVTDPQKVGVL